MAIKTYSDLAFKLDNAGGTLTNLTPYVPNVSIANANTMLDATPIGASSSTDVHGLAKVSIPIGYHLNSTTDAIFGPLLNRTTVNKRFSFYNGIMYSSGNCLPANVEQSGDSNSLILGSCTLNVQGAILRTSKEPT